MKIHQLQTSCCLIKPAQLAAFEVLVNGVNDFWLTEAKLAQPGQNG